MMTAVIWCCFQSFLGLHTSGIRIQRHIVGNFFIQRLQTFCYSFCHVFNGFYRFLFCSECFYGTASNAERSSQEKAVCLSVSLSVRLSNAWTVTKRKKVLSRFLNHTKDHLAEFSEKKNGWWGRPLLPEILCQPAPVRAKSSNFSRYSLVAP